MAVPAKILLIGCYHPRRDFRGNAKTRKYDKMQAGELEAVGNRTAPHRLSLALPPKWPFSQNTTHRARRFRQTPYRGALRER